MSSYTVSFQSQGTETSPTIPGKTSITVAASTLDSTSTSLTLTGRGVPNYGQIQQDNFVRLLENFASKNPPPNPTVGQLWFDSVANTMMVFDMNQTWKNSGGSATVSTSAPSNATGGTTWFDPNSQTLYVKLDTVSSSQASTSGGWVQVGPPPQKYAGYKEYNSLAERINRVVGAPTVYGTATTIGSNEYGWGQTDLLPIFTDASTPTAFNNTNWVTLESRLRKALRHTTVDESTVPTVGFIDDGTGPNATATGYSPAVTFAVGFDGYGIPTLNTYYQAVLDAITALETNRFSVNVVGGSAILALHTDSTTGTWQSDRTLDVQIAFGSDANAKALFNAGFEVRFTFTIPTGASLSNDWNYLITSTGLDAQGFVIDYADTKIGLTGTSLANNGFYALTTTLTDIFTASRPTVYGVYGAGSLVIRGSYDPTTAIMLVEIAMNEDVDPAQTASGQLIGQATITTDCRMPAPSTLGEPGIDTPALTAPTVTTSGTFLTAAIGT